MIDKALLYSKFRKSLGSYDTNATIQREIASELGEIFRLSSPITNRILEIGCGTGFLTREVSMSYYWDSYIINDLVGESVDIAQKSVNAKQITPLVGDIEALEIPSDLDAVVSASTLQWLNDIPLFIERISHSLAEHGLFLFNTFGKNNLIEIKQLTGAGLEYYHIDELREMLSLHFEEVELYEKILSPVFETPIAVLRHLQQTGVSATERFVWTKSKLREFEEQYMRHYCCDNGAVLTWHVIYAVAKKPKRV